MKNNTKKKIIRDVSIVLTIAVFILIAKFYGHNSLAIFLSVFGVLGFVTYVFLADYYK